VAEALRGRVIGGRVVYRESTGSTNDDARALALAGEPEGTVVLADEQTAGRGRAGKARWLTPACTSIAVSVVLRPALPPERLGVLAMLAGVAVVEAVYEVAGAACALKWPNDVMVGERKLGGILVESSLTSSAVSYAVLGIGLNGNVPAAELGPLPANAALPTSLLDEVGRYVSREAVLIALLMSLDALYGQIRFGQTGQLVARYREVLATLGQRVVISDTTQTWEGVAEDVTDEGALVLVTQDGERKVFAHGEVSLRARAL